MKKNKKTTEAFVGLKQVFNSSGKNPHKLDVDFCLTEVNNHLFYKILGSLFTGVGNMSIFGIILFSLFIGWDWLSSVILAIALASSYIGFRVMHQETGDNVLKVARDWKKVQKRVESLGVDLFNSKTPNGAAGIFERKLRDLADDVKKQEYFGKERSRKNSRKEFTEFRNLAKELGFEVSPEKDFFQDRGEVKYFWVI